MQNNALSVSENFRKMAVKSIYAIALFFITYLVLIILGIGVIFLCGLIAYGLVALKFMAVTAALALGFLGMGFLIFFFLIKFIFSSPKKIDRSHLLEITEKQQPELFKMIHEIVNEVQTNFPKKVYLSSDVNASVFYDSSFWSMFFPVKKNLQIGLGLMNSVSEIELKAILAHEFGHFSQRSMKVGSYVYNVNKVIYNMLYENEGYGNLLDRWSDVSAYFVLFSKGSILVIRGIQYVLMKVYRVLNLNYMALSREMEFHADAVAASVAGSSPLANSLLRLGLANQSLDAVFNYYNAKIAESETTNNFYPQHSFIIDQIAKAEELEIQDKLPHLPIEVYKKFNRTKLVLDDQWSSHPSTEQRVAKLEELNLPVRAHSNQIAINLLADKTIIEEMITKRLFEHVKFEKEPVITGLDEFQTQYFKNKQENDYPAVFKGYFDTRDPYQDFTAEDFEPNATREQLKFEDLINDQSAAEINNLTAAISDKATVDNICEGILEINTFDYDGIKYSSADAYSVSAFLDKEIKELKGALEKRDKMLFNFFLQRSREIGNAEDFKTHALAFQEIAKPVQTQRDAYVNLVEATYFMQTTTPFDEIKNNMFKVKKMEEPFKEQVKFLLESDLYHEFIDTDTRSKFEEYLSKDWKYFGHDTYFDLEVELLFNVINAFTLVIFKQQNKLKMSLLEFQAGMIENLTPA
ncbi:M48 family metalloprotease [Pedobacter frigoris]|uniref:M48 family metalloprotease n=1 Tax=Pedobacter frigoris TaxID=2571272 RepID=UPI002930650A|nr:M48 family metalloprotease [Pedobacter frigoris]